MTTRHPIDALALGLDLGCEPDARRLDAARIQLTWLLRQRQKRRERQQVLRAAVEAAESDTTTEGA